jgi:hypothetical protein
MNPMLRMICNMGSTISIINRGIIVTHRFLISSALLVLIGCSVVEPTLKIPRINSVSDSEKLIQTLLIDQAGAAVSSQLLLNSMMQSSLQLQNSGEGLDGTSMRRISANMEPTHELLDATESTRTIKSSVDLTSAALRTVVSEHKVNLSVVGHFVMKNGETELSNFKAELTLTSHGQSSSISFSGNATVNNESINTELNLSICEMNRLLLNLSNEQPNTETAPCEAGALVATFKGSHLSVEGRDLQLNGGVYVIDVKHVRLSGDLANPDETFAGIIDASIFLESKDVGYVRGAFDANNSAELDIKLDVEVTTHRIIVDQ